MSETPEAVPAVDAGWLIYKKGRGFYRPEAAGYTNLVREAGRFTKARAEAEMAVEPGNFSISPAPTDARKEMLQHLQTDTQVITSTTVDGAQTGLIVHVPASAPGCTKMTIEGHLATLVDELEAWFPTLEDFDDGDHEIRIEDRRSLVSLWEKVQAARVALGMTPVHAAEA